METEFGLFLFPPHGEHGAVLRRFVPRAACERAEFGARIGELLVEQASVTPQQVAQAIGMQNEMRSQKLGDILLMRQIGVAGTAARGHRAPGPHAHGAHRRGAGVAGHGQRCAQLKEALGQQEHDRSVPLGELLVRMGVVCRAPTCRWHSLARWATHWSIWTPSRPRSRRLRKVPYGVAQRLRLMPLLIRDGRLIVALDDPASAAAPRWTKPSSARR